MGCTRGATVLLAYDPRTATAWLRDLVDAHPSLGLSLCPTHAERTSVPMGWERVDERRPAWQSYDSDSPFEPEFEPLADVEIFGSSAPAPSPAAAPVVSEPEMPLAAETRSRRRVEEERSFHNGPFDGPASSEPRSDLGRMEDESTASATRLTSSDPAPAPVTALRPLRPAADVTPISRIDAIDDESETFDADFVDAQFGPADAEDADEAFDAIFGLDSGQESAADTVPFDLGVEDDAAPKDEAPIYHVVPVTPPPSVLAAAEKPEPAPVEKPAAAQSETVQSETVQSEPAVTEKPASAPEPAPEEARPSVAKRPAKTVMDDEDISFDDIFPPKVNQPEEPPAQAPRSDQQGSQQQGSQQQGSEGSDRQRSLFGDDLKPSRGITERPDEGYEQRAHGKPVAQATPAVADPVEAPVVGPPRIEARPSYMPTRQGTTSKLQVESSSPLLGRAFGFVQRD